MRSIVLLSGGLDSAVGFKCALDKGEVLCALTFDYGQLAVVREIEATAAMCERFKVQHEIVRLDWLRKITSTALVNRNESVPQLGSADLNDAENSHKTAKAVWVPNRNGVFVSIGASFAEALDADTVVAGFNAEEGETFPDNSTDFVNSVNRGLCFSTLNKVQLWAPTQDLTKTEIVALGRKIEAPLDLVWSCYHGGKRPCGTCESCTRFLRATGGIEGMT